MEFKDSGQLIEDYVNDSEQPLPDAAVRAALFDSGYDEEGNWENFYLAVVTRELKNPKEAPVAKILKDNTKRIDDPEVFQSYLPLYRPSAYQNKLKRLFGLLVMSDEEQAELEAGGQSFRYYSDNHFIMQLRFFDVLATKVLADELPVESTIRFYMEYEEERKRAFRGANSHKTLEPEELEIEVHHRDLDLAEKLVAELETTYADYPVILQSSLTADRELFSSGTLFVQSQFEDAMNKNAKRQIQKLQGESLEDQYKAITVLLKHTSEGAERARKELQDKQTEVSDQFVEAFKEKLGSAEIISLKSALSKIPEGLGPKTYAACEEGFSRLVDVYVDVDKRKNDFNIRIAACVDILDRAGELDIQLPAKFMDVHTQLVVEYIGIVFGFKQWKNEEKCELLDNFVNNVRVNKNLDALEKIDEAKTKVAREEIQDLKDNGYAPLSLLHKLQKMRGEAAKTTSFYQTIWAAEEDLVPEVVQQIMKMEKTFDGQKKAIVGQAENYPEGSSIRKKYMGFKQQLVESRVSQLSPGDFCKLVRKMAQENGIAEN